MKSCKYCGEPIGADKRKDARYCSNTCKAKYHEQNAGKEVKIEIKQSLGNVFPEIKLNPPKKTVPKPEMTKSVLEPFRNVLSGSSSVDAVFSGAEKQVSSDTESELVLPPMYLEKKEKLPNPVYQELNQKLSACRKEIKTSSDLIAGIDRAIEQEKNRNGAGLYWGGTGGGALLGYLLAGNEKDEDDKRWLYSIIGGVLGFSAGNITNNIMSEDREKEKAANISKLKSHRMQEVKKLDDLKAQERRLNMTLLLQSSELVRTYEVPNPEYALALKRQAEAQENKSSSDSGGVSVNKNPLETERIIQAKNVVAMNIPLLDFKSKWLNFFGQPQTNFFLVIHGMSGEGKSVFTIQLAKYLAENFGNVLYISGEEGFVPTLQKKIEEMGAKDVPALYFSNYTNASEILAEVPNKYHFIVLDSINNMDIDPEQMKLLRQHFNQSGFIAIAQSTKDDKIRGSYQIVHDSDIAVKVNNGIAVTTKNRFKEKGMEFNAFAAFGK